jgi:hypothetical protein
VVMMMPDDNHLSLAGFRRRQPVGVGLSTGRIALVSMDGRLQEPVSEVAGWPYAVLSVGTGRPSGNRQIATMRI